jgi:5-methylcytosine-specific restriction enzyme A
MFDQAYVYKKEIDWSTLHEGLNIPVSIQIVFQKNIQQFITRGQTKEINIVLDGKTYQAKLVNQAFDRQKYHNRKDILQIRYNRGSDLAVRLREVFAGSYAYFLQWRNQSEKKKQYIKVPKDRSEYLAIYTTNYPDTYIFDCIFNETRYSLKDEVLSVGEAAIEYYMNTPSLDPSAGIDLSNRLVKIRRLNRAIGNSLKELYDYNCQLCGNNFSRKYDVEIVEAHHIVPFTVSLNNDADNIIVLCPNHHTTVHKAEPIFDKKKLFYVYRNGFKEQVALNHHLNSGAVLL